MFTTGSVRQDADASIRATDSDASLARLSAVKKGYLSDPFIAHFVPRAQSQPSRPPLINIGTTIRSESIDELVDSWLATCESKGVKCQIVSLGAGSDTRFWRIATGPRKESLVRYVEVDFAEVTAKKVMTIKKNKALMVPLGDASSVAVGGGGTNLSSQVYNLYAADLRSAPSETMSGIAAELLDRTVPTLLLFECVLAYMSQESSDSLIAFFAEHFKDSAPLAGIVYEMFGLEDSFGQVMKNNLKARNIEIPGVASYTSEASLPQRFLRLDFSTAAALTLYAIRRQHFTDEVLRRMSELEMLDEVEELDLVLAHYAITWGVKVPTVESLLGDSKSPWLKWGMHSLRSTKPSASI